MTMEAWMHNNNSSGGNPTSTTNSGEKGSEGSRPYWHFMVLDSLNVTYPGSEQDRKEAESAHLKGYDHRFVLLVKKMTKKQRVYDGDRTHPRLRTLDEMTSHMIQTTLESHIANRDTVKSMGVMKYFETYFYPGFPMDYKKAENNHYEWEDDTEFYHFLIQMQTKQYAFRESQGNANASNAKNNHKNNGEKKPLSKFAVKKWKKLKGLRYPFQEEEEQRQQQQLESILEEEEEGDDDDDDDGDEDKEEDEEQREPQQDEQHLQITSSSSSIHLLRDTQQIQEERTAAPSLSVSNTNNNIIINNNNINSMELTLFSPINLLESTQDKKQRKAALSSPFSFLLPSAVSKKKRKKKKNKRKQVQEEAETKILQILQSHQFQQLQQTNGNSSAVNSSSEFEQESELERQLPEFPTLTPENLQHATKSFIHTTFNDATDLIVDAIEVNGIDMMCNKAAAKHFVHDALLPPPSDFSINQH